MPPFMYKLPTGNLANSFTTSATPFVDTEHAFVKPGSLRTLGLNRVEVHGRGAALTTLSGITFRLKKWTTGGASGGTSQTPNPSDHSIKAASATAGMSCNANVTAGTGGPTFLGSFGCGGAGPGGWVSMNPDDVFQLEASNNQSFGLWANSGTASMVWDGTIGIQE